MEAGLYGDRENALALLEILVQWENRETLGYLVRNGNVGDPIKPCIDAIRANKNLNPVTLRVDGETAMNGATQQLLDFIRTIRRAEDF